MTNLKPGDRITCRLNEGRIVSLYSPFEEEKDFEIIAADSGGYFLYVPEYYSLRDTKLVTSANIHSLNISKKFLDTFMIYVSEGHVLKIREILDGMNCSSCHEFFKYSAANQENGTLICWSCRSYPYYR